MKSYYLKHRLMSRIGEPLFLFYDYYHEEYDCSTMESIEGFKNARYIFSYSEIVELTKAGFDFDEEWKIISLDDFYNEAN